MSLPTRSLIEMTGVIFTGVGHLVFVNLLNAKAAFIAVSLGAWAGYISIRVRGDRTLLGVWGFHRNNLRSVLWASSAVTAMGLGTMALIGFYRASLTFHWHMLPLLLLYPVWGIIQQFLIQSLVAGNLSRASGFISSAGFVTVVCAVLFGLVHLPDVTLSVGTFLLGLAFTPLYLKWRNLLPLGIYHGWLGVFVYFWVLNRDPWIEVFGH